ncbi:MAG: hypothetical protein UU81_C0044G0012 [Microgenomates group bacterium GW2011_GWC1_41_8]|uniref:Uncharacterized protein n=3 Tax=Candidatus Roizmaniibacteriota TaxID=1752723 RepID=A0A0G0ZJ92_9BACT|nr:MAG: hypothetical protein UU14_C0008G0022 [Candidatus Roizmanbacteria bacterium GW2011_GWB1_40_7]KKR94278.1 MAG: hypothetical protein UU41_C0009G0024 [Candidatus Roizmanbacteria bacterium GW2011_GWA1_41_13]KKS22096.1 MAG: hypothetical protein UU78_C0023G0022 [Candidatus Roizmanbacteria bacterium GW2011_GWC2_41_7]KKS22976.1 MAG: hypothetical protein UU81_C0044G0012 [Microgenomates group bacterium GW2011_GWC1_41_8]
MPNLLWLIINIFYFPAYFFFGFINVLFQASGIGKHEIVACQTASILYIPIWFIILTLIYYGLHKTRKVEKQLQFISKHRHVFLVLYSFVVLWMYSVPVGCEDIWEIVPGGLFIHRGMPVQFSGASYEGIMVQYPFVNLFYAEIPSHRVIWYIPNMLTNFAIILVSTYLTYFILKHLPIHIHRHIRRKSKK